jgi:hypothetical protein
MLSEDYVIRMIQLAVAALLKILGLRKLGLYDDALVAVDLGLEQLLGLRASRVKSLDDERLYYLLTQNDRPQPGNPEATGGRLDTRRLALVSELFEVEGDIYADQGRGSESQQDYARALRYAIEVYFQERDQAPAEDESYTLEPGEEGPGSIETQVIALLLKVRPEALGADTLWPMAGYYEDTGQYSRAEAILVRMSDWPELRSEMLPELAAFYGRLLEKPAGVLSAVGMDPAKIRESLKRISTSS